MKVFAKIILIFFLFFPINVCAEEYLYILNDKCINELFIEAKVMFENSEIEPIRDSRGLILRYNFANPIKEYYNSNINVYKQIEYFLAKIENPAIIEVHTGDFSNEEIINLKKWEVSTLIANKIEAIITKPKGVVSQDRINSIGYGEFLPAKNTSNNGGKNSNRIDIIILCNISGE